MGNVLVPPVVQRGQIVIYSSITAAEYLRCHSAMKGLNSECAG